MHGEAQGKGGGRAYLACSVDNVTVVLYTIIFDVLGKGILDGRVIGFHEGIVDVLNDERGFTCV